MNHVYRLIWNRVLSAWVVASEAARGRGKCGSGVARGRRAAQRAGFGHGAAVRWLPLSGIGIAVIVALSATQPAVAQSCTAGDAVGRNGGAGCGPGDDGGYGFSLYDDRSGPGGAGAGDGGNAFDIGGGGGGAGRGGGGGGGQFNSANGDAGGGGGAFSYTQAERGYGGGGGGGGATGLTDPGSVITGTVAGGNGGAGANGSGGSVTGGGGGGGGGGGFGVVIQTPGSYEILGAVAGGDGGKGGDGGTPGQYPDLESGGGGGGAGGAGVRVTGAQLSIAAGATVTGGSGGAGGLGQQFDGSFAAGNGGDGQGGAGILAANAAISVAGAVSGGLAPDGSRGAAIAFVGGNNSLAFQNATSGLTGGILLQNNASVAFQQATDVLLASEISGNGSITKNGAGTLVLTGDSSGFAGGTTISAGTLRVDGSLGGNVAARGGVLTGAGSIGGDADLTSGGIFNGAGGQTLRVGGNVLMDATSTVNAVLGAASNAALIDVGGNLTLDGKLNVVDAGNFGWGVYRLFSYAGSLTDNGLEIGAIPAGFNAADITVQTSVAHTVNLVSSIAGGLSFWDGGNTALHGNGQVDGGSGAWTANDSNWIEYTGTANGPYQPIPTYAVFQNVGGVVAVDDTAGGIGVTGMQFAADGYRVEGDAIGLLGAGGKTTIRVGDGTAAGIDMTATIASALTGDSTLVKNDLGTLVLTGANTYRGGTQVAAGTLAGNALSIRGNIANAGTVEFDQAADASFSGDIAGLGGTNGAMVKSGLGNLTLTGTSSLDWSIKAGSVSADAGRFTGNAAIASGANLTFDQAADASYAGVISGAGAFTKAGAGSLTLTGDSSAFAGTTHIEEGLLSVNGRLGGTLNITGGKLGGSGTIENLVVSGSVAPGNSIGTLNVGTISFNPGSVYQVEVNAAGQSDRIVASGAATINGGSVQVLAGAGNYAPQTRYTILSAGGGRSGLFTGVASNLAFLDPALSYDANNVYLTMTRNSTTLASVGRTRNQIAAAGGVNSLGWGNAVYDTALNLSAGQARHAFDQLSGEIQASAQTALLEDSRFVRDAARDRLRAAQAAPGASRTAVAAYGAHAGPEQAAATRPGPLFWTSVYGSWGKSDGNGNAAALDRSSNGLLMGMDGEVGDWRLGLLTGYGQSRFDTSDPSASGSSNNYHLGAYGGTAWGNLSLRTGAAYTWHEIDTKRSVAVAGLADSHKSRYHGGTFQAFGELAYAAQINGVRVEPFANLSHVRLRTDGGSEQGGATALRSDKSADAITFTTLGGRGEHAFELGSARAALSGSVGWRYAAGDTTPAATQRFAGGSAFTVEGVPVARNSAVIEAGIGLALTRNAALSISYMGQLSSSAQDHGGRASLSVRF
jgi:outer membrane autotransporter protein